MTFCAAIENESSVVFVGDVLLTNGGLPTLGSIPTKPLSSQMRSGQGFVSGLMQKLHVVDDWLLFAFADRVSEARKVAEHLYRESPNIDRTIGAVASSIDSIPTLDRSKVDLIIGVLGESGLRMLRGGTYPYPLHPFTRVTTIGTGTQDFVATIAQNGDDEGEISNVRLVGLSTGFMAMSMSNQRYSDYGMELGWGGAFEVAFSGPRGFEKLNNRLERTFFLDVDDRRPARDRMIPHDFTASWYNDSDLIVGASSLQHGTHVYVVGSLLNNQPSPLTSCRFRPSAINDVVLYYREVPGGIRILKRRTNLLLDKALIFGTPGRVEIKDHVEFDLGARRLFLDLDPHYVEWYIDDSIKLAASLPL